MAAARDGPGDKDKVVERPVLQAVGLRERTKDTTEQTSLHSSRKQTPFPQINKTIGSREKTKPGKNYICKKQASAAGCWYRLCVMAGQAFSLKCTGKKSTGGLLAAAETCRMALIHGGGQMWVLLPWQTAGSSGGSIAELSIAQREQKRELLVSVPHFKRDPASFPCCKPG